LARMRLQVTHGRERVGTLSRSGSTARCYSIKDLTTCDSDNILAA
jgi:hypothetical protein